MKMSLALAWMFVLILAPRIGSTQSHELLLEMRYVAYRLNVYTDGNVEYFDDFRGKATTPTTKTLPPEKVRQLIEAFDKANFSSLEDSYASTETTLQDGTVVNYRTGRPPRKLRFIHDGNDKTVKYSVLPPPLQELHSQIQKIVGVDFGQHNDEKH